MIFKKKDHYLCCCNNCDNIYIDSNPQFNAQKHDCQCDYKSLIIIEDMHACPVCLTDEYLTDNVDFDQLTKKNKMANLNTYKDKILEYILPSHLASYLINNDQSGLTDSEKIEIDNFLAREKIAIIDIEPGSSSYYHNNDLNQLGCMCNIYYAHYINESIL